MANRLFGAYSIFRRTGSLAVKPIPPRWRGSPMGKPTFSVRPGAIAWELVPNVDNEFKWDSREVIHLSPTEVGEFAVADLAQGPLEIVRQVYDPETHNQTVQKRLTVTEAEAGYNVKLNVREDWEQEIVITDAELFVIKNLMFSSLPHLVGFTQTFDANPEVPPHMLEQPAPSGNWA